MAVFMFWNTKRASLYDEISVICRDNDVDIAVFAELMLDPIRLLQTLNRNVSRYFFQIPSIGTSRLQFFTRYPLEWIEPRYDDRWISIDLLRKSPDLFS
jgi:hypothetical protein